MKPRFSFSAPARKVATTAFLSLLLTACGNGDTLEQIYGKWNCADKNNQKTAKIAMTTNEIRINSSAQKEATLIYKILSADKEKKEFIIRQAEKGFGDIVGDASFKDNKIFLEIGRSSHYTISIQNDNYALFETPSGQISCERAKR